MNVISANFFIYCNMLYFALDLLVFHTFNVNFFFQVITCEEAEIRGRRYDQEAMTYLFDLDFVGDPLYSVDARYMGNISHFVNHSVSLFRDSNKAFFVQSLR